MPKRKSSETPYPGRKKRSDCRRKRNSGEDAARRLPDH
jgi:hypothetical protein